MISIIIPTLNEEKNIYNTLTDLSRIDIDKEIIITDGGSTDKTLEIANKFQTVIVNAHKGRANQMNTAVKKANGDILWFLHADSKVENNSINHIYQTIKKEDYDAGCFSVYFYDYKNFNMKWLALTSNMRAKYLGLIFGDQGLFFKKEIFKSLNGFKNIPIMEDWDISKRLHKIGKVKILKTKIGTSGRRFKQQGFIKTLINMHIIKLKYVLGIDPEKISQQYKDIR